VKEYTHDHCLDYYLEGLTNPQKPQTGELNPGRDLNNIPPACESHTIYVAVCGVSALCINIRSQKWHFSFATNTKPSGISEAWLLILFTGGGINNNNNNNNILLYATFFFVMIQLHWKGWYIV